MQIKTLLVLAVLFGCSGKAKQDQDQEKQAVSVTCLVNPYLNTPEKESVKKWEIVNWENSCTRLFNPHSSEYIGPKEIKDLL